MSKVKKFSKDCKVFKVRSGSQDQLYKLENFGWLVDVATDRPACYF